MHHHPLVFYKPTFAEKQINDAHVGGAKIIHNSSVTYLHENKWPAHYFVNFFKNSLRIYMSVIFLFSFYLTKIAKEM